MNNRGIVLVLVLWILTIMMVIALSVSYVARTDLSGTILYVRDLQNRYYALAGLERAKAELLYRQYFLNDETADVWRVDGTEYEFELGNGNVVVKITSEIGKIDINHAHETLLKNLLINQGLNEEQAEALVDAIIDFRDPDNVPRPKGAEEEYYSSLERPYKVKNSNYESLDELLYVKGMTRELLYGDQDKKGLIDLLTIYSGHRNVSIKYAPKEVLKAVPGLSDEMVEAILQRRKEKQIRGPHDIQDIIGEGLANLTQYLNFGDSQIFTVVSEGRSSQDRKAKAYAIKAVIAREMGNKFSYKYYKEPVSAGQ